MARIRTIKPEFPQSESMGRVSRDSRLCFIQLWTLADDEGRLRGNSRMLASLLFPYDDDAPELIDGWLQELEGQSSIRQYQIGGTSYVQVTEWAKHQKIDKPSPSKIPPIPADFEHAPHAEFDESSRILAKVRESSSEDQGSRIKDMDQGMDQGSKDRQRVIALTVSDLVAAGVTDQTAKEFLALRKQKRAKLTERAWSGIVKQAGIAGWSIEDVLCKCLARGWQSFEAEWVKRDQHRPGAMSDDDRARVNAESTAKAKRMLFGDDSEVIDV